MRFGKKTWGCYGLLSFFLPLLPAGYFAINRPAKEKYSKQSIYIFKHLKGQLDPPVSNVTFFNHGGRLGPPVRDVTLFFLGDQSDPSVNDEKCM